MAIRAARRRDGRIIRRRTATRTSTGTRMKMGWMDGSRGEEATRMAEGVDDGNMGGILLEWID